MNDYLALVKPSVITGVHRSFLEVGVDVIMTCSFRANRITLKEYGLEDRVLEINRAAAGLARRVADEFATADEAALCGRLDRPDRQAALGRRPRVFEYLL